jgi:thiamine kinase-like enzyme
LINDKVYLYFDIKSGDAIKKWVIGDNPSFQQVCSSTFLKAFAKTLNKLHDIDTKNKKVLKHDYLDCLKKAKLPAQHRTIYLSLIKQYKNLPLVLSHNDLSAENLIYTSKHQVIFIDYEWSRLNNQYWDVANFIREANLPINKIKELSSYLKVKNIKALLNFVYLSTNYAYQWTFNMPMNPKIKKYRAIVLKKMTRYLGLIKYV